MTATGTGEVLAVVGSRDPDDFGFNRALDAVRPIGSLAKPAVYLAALAHPDRYTLASRVSDAPVRVEGSTGKAWTPANYDGRSHGQVPLYEALARSYNQATVRIGLDIGVDEVADYLHRLGVQRRIEVYPAMMLGGLRAVPAGSGADVSHAGFGRISGAVALHPGSDGRKGAKALSLRGRGIPRSGPRAQLPRDQRA